MIRAGYHFALVVDPKGGLFRVSEDFRGLVHDGRYGSY